jgi:DNA-binding Lrp family transcriptional regulator
MGFDDAPKEVQAAFEELKLTLGKRLSLHSISNNYYVYEYSSLRDPRSMRMVVRTFYIGHITRDGRFISKEERKLARLEAARPDAERTRGEAVDDREIIALRNLSMNGRMPMGRLAKRLGMSQTGTRHFIKRLEKKYNIRYFAELNTLKLGYLRYIALVKFKNKAPSIAEIKAAFEEDPHIALVAMTKGQYDMIVIFYVENQTQLTNFMNFIYEWRSTRALPDYTAQWYVTPLSKAFENDIPLRKQFADDLEKLVWIKKTTKLANQLTQNEYSVLKELITDGNKSFREIDEKYGFNPGRSNYAFYKLKENEMLYRITISIDPPDLKYNAIFITQTNNYRKFNESRDDWLKYTISEDKPWINRYAFRGDMGVPDGMFFVKPIFDNQEFYKEEEKLGSIKGTNTTSLIITNIVIGSLCYRNFDMTHSEIYEVLIKNNKIQSKEKTDYQ